MAIKMPAACLKCDTVLACFALSGLDFQPEPSQGLRPGLCCPALSALYYLVAHPLLLTETRDLGLETCDLRCGMCDLGLET